MKILKFYSPTCPPCRQLNALNLTMGKTLHPVDEINIQERSNIDIKNKYQITGVPATILLDDHGVEVSRAKGLQGCKTMMYGD